MTDGAFFRSWISGVIIPKMFEQLTENKMRNHGFVYNRIAAGRVTKIFRN